MRLTYKHPELSANVKPYMKETIEVDLKKSGLNFEWLHYLRFVHKGEKDDYDREMAVLEDMTLKLLETQGEIQLLLQKEVFQNLDKHPLLAFAKMYNESQLQIVCEQL